MSAEVSRQLASDQSFRDQVRVAALTAAIAVSSEETTVANHVNRAQLARQVLMSPQRWSEIMAEAVAVNAAIAATAAQGLPVPQNDIEFAVNTLWDAYAGPAPEAEPA